MVRLGLAVTRAWNDWLYDSWYSPYPERIIPLGITYLADPEQGAREIRLVNRTPTRAKVLERELGSPIRALAWEDREAALGGAAMLINTTSQGMVGELPLVLSLDALPAAALVSDIIYIPRETPLLAAARKRGNPTVNGLGMLLHQARPAFRAWFGIMPEVTPELRAMIEART